MSRKPAVNLQPTMNPQPTMNLQPTMNAQPPPDLSYLFEFDHDWDQSMFGSFKPCPQSAFACFCNPCYTAKLIDRTGDDYCTGYMNPCSLMAVRTKVRTAFRIEGGLVQDCLTTTLCCAPCAAMQIDHELDYQGVPGMGIKRSM